MHGKGPHLSNPEYATAIPSLIPPTTAGTLGSPLRPKPGADPHARFIMHRSRLARSVVSREADAWCHRGRIAAPLPCYLAAATPECLPGAASCSHTDLVTTAEAAAQSRCESPPIGATELALNRRNGSSDSMAAREARCEGTGTLSRCRPPRTALDHFARRACPTAGRHDGLPCAKRGSATRGMVRPRFFHRVHSGLCAVFACRSGTSSVAAAGACGVCGRH